MMINSLRTLVLTVALSALAGLGFFAVGVPSAHATFADNVSGWAWSSNIGWISMNCTDLEVEVVPPCDISPYGVNMDIADGDGDGFAEMDGYAWSSEVGWISFNASDVAGCPNPAGFSEPCEPGLDLSNQQLRGWARAVRPDIILGDDLGGWDGWISLRCFGDPAVPGDPCSINQYGTIVGSSGSFNGMAWGSEPVGWISMDGVEVDTTLPTVSIDAYDATGTSTVTSVTAGEAIELRWEVGSGTVWASMSGTGTPDCAVSATPADPVFSGYRAASDGNQTGVIPVIPATTYTIECTPAGGGSPVADSVTVMVNSLATPVLLLEASPAVVGDADFFRTNLRWSSPTGHEFDGCIATNDGAVGEWEGPQDAISGTAPIQFAFEIPVPISPTRYTLACNEIVSGDVYTASVEVLRDDPLGAIDFFATLNPAVYDPASPTGYRTNVRWRNVGAQSYTNIAISGGAGSSVWTSYVPTTSAADTFDPGETITVTGVDIPAAGTTLFLDATPTSGPVESYTLPITVAVPPNELSITPSTFLATAPDYEIGLSWNNDSSVIVYDSCREEDGDGGATWGGGAPQSGLAPGGTDTKGAVAVPFDPTDYTVQCIRAGSGDIDTATTSVNREAPPAVAVSLAYDNLDVVVDSVSGTYSGTVELIWGSIGATTCHGDWNGSTSYGSGTAPNTVVDGSEPGVAVTPQPVGVNTTNTIVCYNADGTESATASVSYNQDSPPSSGGINPDFVER